MRITRRRFLETGMTLAGGSALSAMGAERKRVGAEARRFWWWEKSVAAEFRPMLRALAEEYPLREAPDGMAREGEIALCIERHEGYAGHRISNEGKRVTIGCSRRSEAGRALGTLMAGLVPEGGAASDKCAFETLGIVLDCGHNATVRPAHLRKWLRRLSLMGYNVALVYTEAGYRLPDEPCFGYMRGNYRKEDLTALDDYARALGIEMIGSIQALGHLEQLLKWPPYAGLRDTEHVLMVGEPKTYALIDKMVAHWASAFKSRRFHLGMDETYDLGRGRYLDRHGYRRGLDIYVEHLAKVTEICERHGLRPMIWSDVLFKLANASGGHYDEKTRLPDDVAKALPKNVDLVYWDYYRPEKEHYMTRIASHRALGAEPIMTSGVWSWPNFWHNWRLTERNAGPCVDACRETGLKEILFSLWSDDGAFWELDSSFAGLAYAAEKCFGDGGVVEANMGARFSAICFSDLETHRVASTMNQPFQSCDVMWDDPMLAMYLRKVGGEDLTTLAEAERHYLGVAAALEPHATDRAAGDLGHAALVAKALAAKVGMANRLLRAYAGRDRAGLAAVREQIAPTVTLIERLARSFRGLWLERCEPFGLEVLQIRFAGLAARYRELEERLSEFLAGRIESIPELDEGAKGAWVPAPGNRYRSLATGSRVF